MKRYFIFVLMLLTVVIVGCTAVSDSHSESVVTKLEHTSLHPEPVNVDISDLLVEYNTVDVETNSATFQAVTHTNELEKYPCSSCHKPESGDVVETETEPHWNITLNHASADVMTCTTCHTTENFDYLHTLADTPVEFDHSYQVCAQCHTSQYDDWVGGAHGKRMEGWAEPRVVESCVGCHNPHSPEWEKRWPAVTGGGTGE